jgi:tRNA-dihydrouridine synthase
VHKYFDNPLERLAPEGIRVPAELRVGSVRIAPATVLAPMAGVTDTVFRRFIREMGGCGLLMTEFTSADGVVRWRDATAKRYRTSLRTSAPSARSSSARMQSPWPRPLAASRLTALTWWT